MGLTINFNNTEFITINIDKNFHNNIEVILQWSKFKTLNNLGVTLNKKGTNSEDIVSKTCKEG